MSRQEIPERSDPPGRASAEATRGGKPDATPDEPHGGHPGRESVWLRAWIASLMVLGVIAALDIAYFVG